MEKFKLFFTAVVVGSVLFGSCKSYFDPPLVFEEDPGPNTEKARKVLLISIDGLSGIELQDYMPTQLSTLLEHSKYTLDGIADANTGDASTWTTMLSGLGSGRHGVNGNDFDADVTDPDNPNHEGGGDGGFIPVYQRLLETGRLYQSLSVTSWDLLYDNLFPLSDQRVLVQSDEEVKLTAVDSIKNSGDRLTFSTINFRSVNAAGIAGGFSLENAAYKAALDQVDTYIGEIVDAVEARQNYARENWLIIITSNHGGTDNSYGGASFEERKVPVIFYNERFEPLRLRAPDLGQFVSLTGPWSAPVRAAVPADKATAFNFGTAGGYTVQLKMKLKNRGDRWPTFFGKKKSSNYVNAEPGWLFMFYDPKEKPTWSPFIGDESGASINTSSNRGINTDQWTTLTMKIYEENGKRYVQGFTDGDKHEIFEITGRNLENNEPLILGGMAGWISTTATFDVSDIRIYNAALPDEYITSTYCQAGLTEEDNYYKDLIAYWPIKEGAGGLLEDVIGDADFVFERPAIWTIGERNFCNLPPVADSENPQRIINQVDILPQIYYWLNMEPFDSWGLEGTVFLNAYEREFVGEE
ncbi:alkaline phosphatase family protein [Sphingobacterium deserti]|uniref:Type I phosphodiesterase/nucleotide pyrophosphatase n=1 Tax=Sphingobacterium deserti TaxID=1229276 RepID=A0A0B8T2T4_9SPHI|nr:alkaline phosphatase family protein [Sphingobacterium deserti]KGE15667.1 type I phosphodiesterase/nucleotide pyrophosphatase [Sphingobacterium deserti]